MKTVKRTAVSLAIVALSIVTVPAFAASTSDASGSSSFVQVSGTGMSNISGGTTSTTQSLLAAPGAMTGTQQVWATSYAGLSAPGGALMVNTANQATTSASAIPGAAASGGAGSAFLTASAFKGVVSASLVGAGQSQSWTPSSLGSAQVNTHDNHVTLSLLVPVTNTIAGGFNFGTSAN